MDRKQQHVTRQELDNDIEDVRGDVGVNIQKVREEWRNELKLTLKGFKTENRLLIAGAILVLKLHIPAELTALPVAALALKAGIGLFFKS